MNNRKKKKGIKMSFIMMARENGDTKHDARRLFKGVRRLKHLRKLKAQLNEAIKDEKERVKNEEKGRS